MSDSKSDSYFLEIQELLGALPMRKNILVKQVKSSTVSDLRKEAVINVSKKMELSPN